MISVLILLNIHAGFTESSSEGAALGCIGLAVSDGFDFTKWKRMGE